MNSKVFKRSLGFVGVLFQAVVTCSGWGQPDLRPTGLEGPAVVETQHTMEISWTVENGGTAEARASWYDSVYLSTDDTVGGGDIGLTNPVWSETVVAGGDYGLSATVTVPNLPAGDYYLILVVDVFNNVYEDNEANNQQVRAVEIRTPDLRPTGLEGPAVVETQHTMEISWTVENGGTAEAKASWNDIVYLSTDDVVGGGDIGLTNLSWSEAVVPGGDYGLSATVNVPNLPAGDYYLILVVDVYNNVYEENEGNNKTHRSIRLTGPETLRVVAMGWMENGRLQIDFQSVDGLVHNLEWCDDMGEGDWTPQPFYVSEDATETQDSIDGTGEILSIYVTPEGSPCYYRVVGQ